MSARFEDVGQAAREILDHPQTAASRWRRPEIVLLAAEVARVARALEPTFGSSLPSLPSRRFVSEWDLQRCNVHDPSGTRCGWVRGHGGTHTWQVAAPNLGERGPAECVHLGGGLCDCGWPRVDCPHNRYAQVDG